METTKTESKVCISLKVGILLVSVFLNTNAMASFSELACSPSNNQDLVTIVSKGANSRAVCRYQNEIYKAYLSAFSDVSSQKLTIASFIAFDSALGILQQCDSVVEGVNYCDIRQNNLQKLMEKQHDSNSKTLLAAQLGAVIQLCGD
ncbi:MAG: hypothetical protein ACXVCY_12665 [Pseudobdellovibrionaceae bacterium]